MKFTLATLCLLILTTLNVSADTLDEQLVEATQQQNLKEVERLLAAGASVDAANRYGASALLFAADKGEVEMVRLLLEKGAKVDVTDTFYAATPLTWALFKASDSKPHREVVLLILGKAPADVSQAVSFSVQTWDLELLRAAVDTGNVDAKSLKQALASAEGEKKEEFIAYLKPLMSAEDEQKPQIVLTAEDLKPYLGDFENKELGMKVVITSEENQLLAQATGQPVIHLDPTGDDHAFQAREAAIGFTFSGRAGLIEGFQLEQGSSVYGFPRVAVTSEAADAADEKALPAIPVAKRLPAAPWPSFRGANASGVGDGQGVVTAWNGEKGENVIWKTPIPGIALSSPIVWGDRIFITTAASEEADDTFRTGNYGDVDSVDDDSIHDFRIYALAKDTGRILWQRDADRGVPQVKRHLKSSHANPTPVTDGKYVVAHFGSEGLFCYTMDGELKWKVDLGRLDSGWFFDSSYQWGFASSPILHEGKVIVQTDIHKGSFMAAFDIATGKELWRTQRDEIPTWGTPSILPAATAGGVDEVVTNGTTVRGYSAASGEELWTLSPNSEVTVGTPVVADGMAFVTGGYPPARPIYAIRPGGRGDLSLAAEATSSDFIAWTVQPGGTYIPSPIAYRGILYMLNNNGRLAAYDSKTGERLYRVRVGRGATSFSASPVAADGRLFLTTEEGDTHVIRAGKDYEHLGVNEIGEVVMTTPAISDGLMVIRGMDHVYAVGAKKAAPGEQAADSETATSEK